MVRNEMKWTVAYYEHQSLIWRNACKEYPDASPGAKSYADRKADTWMSVAKYARNMFKANDCDNAM